MDMTELKKLVETKKTVFGLNETLYLAKKGDLIQILVASNCPSKIKKQLDDLKIEIVSLDKTNYELMEFCRTSFKITVIGIKK